MLFPTTPTKRREFHSEMFSRRMREFPFNSPKRKPKTEKLETLSMCSINKKLYEKTKRETVSYYALTSESTNDTPTELVQENPQQRRRIPTLLENLPGGVSCACGPHRDCGRVQDGSVQSMVRRGEAGRLARGNRRGSAHDTCSWPGGRSLVTK